MEKQAKEHKKKEEEDFKRFEFEVRIAGEDFLTFILNLAQQILEIQKDKASEEKVQEHTPAQKQVLKGKVLDYSKRTIERGVKERKRTERDRDDSDFVYPKQKRKLLEILFHSLWLRLLLLVSARQKMQILSQKSGN